MIKKIIFVFTICIISINIMAQSKTKNQKDEYVINAQAVTKEKFDSVLSTLKEIPETYHCAKTATGGRISYKVKDEATGTMYMYGAMVNAEKSRYNLTILLNEISTKKDEYKIDGKLVTEKEFNALLSKLKQLPNSWFCAETSNGGCSGYSAKDKNDITYDYSFCIENGIGRSCSLAKKNLF